MSGCPGLLELLHPDGALGRAVILGSACPDPLRPEGGDSPPPWDLAIVAPSPRESATRTWVSDTVALLAAELRHNGIVYLIARAADRRRIARALGGAGLIADEHLLHLPSIASSELLLPLERRAFQSAARLLVTGSARNAALRAGSLAPGALGLLARVHPGVGVVARRRGGRALGSWLLSRTGGERIALLRSRSRRDRARAVVHPLGGDRVAKIVLRSPDPPAEIRREALALESLGPAARAAGAAVPTCSVMELPGRCPILLLDTLQGSPAASVLLQRPSAYPDVLRRLAGWLEAWSRATRRHRRLDDALLEAWVLGPARRLAERLEDGPDYLTWLTARCVELFGRSVPLIATHNDLTMVNVLLQADGRLAVLDWEAATAEGLPLRDFVYAAVDAAAASARYRDRPAAFDRCFAGGGDPLVGGMLRRLSEAVELPDEFATVAFHACWLQHAEDELRKRAAGEPLPFLECLRRAAARRRQL